MDSDHRSFRKNPFLRHPIYITLLILASLAVAYFTFTATRQLVTAWAMTPLGGISIQKTNRQ